MSKIGSWVLELQEKKKETRQLNPYDRHSNKDNSSRQYYVDYSNNKAKSHIMVQLRSS